MNTRWGGFLENFDQFDPLFFGISPREAAAMDPQHRLLLEVAWETLWNAGIAPDKMQGSSTGVFLGVAGADYARLLLDDARSIGPHTCAGVAHSMASGRISFLLDLHGPSITVDTACSSSLVAVHLACQSLRAGSCRTAMAGGVSLKFRPEHYLCLSKLGMTSPTGKCQTFDASGDGFVPGEGCGMVLLKPLTDALVERCRIYAVIRGAAANQDGRTTSLTAPSGLAQQGVIRSALTNGRVAPADISYVETHGTGTALGDPIEVEALSETIGSKSVSVEPCALGAVKTNIGHLESASGIAGFIKAVLALHHEEIPSNLHYHRLNSHLALEGTRFFLPLQTAPWPRSASPRFAAVSSFGFSGTNAHIVLEEAPGLPAAPQPAEPVEMHSFVLPISARTSQACDAMAGSIRDFLDGDGLAVPLYNICHSAANRRSHYEERLALTAESRSSLRTLLDDYLSGRAVPGVSRGRTALDNQQVVFVFSGQGSQWPRMGLELYSHFPAFRAALDACDAEIQRFAGWSVIETISSAASELDRTAYAQPAIFAVELSLAKLWQSWGIMPTSVLGHSVGEIAAAHIAGALSLESAARMVVMRGRLMEVAAGRGKMAVLYQRSSEVAGEILPYGEAISIACVNSPFSTVISGESSAVDALLARQHARGIASRAVRVEYAFHSAQMQSCSEAFAREIGPIARETLQIPMISTVTGTRIRAADLDGSYWARNIRQPVLFADAVHAAAELGGQIFLEVGPHPVLLGSIAECAESRFSPSSVLPSTKRGANESQSMLTSLGKLYVAGCSIAWDRVYPDHVPAVELPVYPYQRERIWLEERPKHAPLPETRPLAMRQIRSPELAKEVFETRIGIESMPWLADHRIAGTLLLPMTAFIEIARRALEAAGRAPAALSDFAIIKPLVVPGQQERTVQVIFEHDLFQIFSLYGDTWTLHATGRSNTAQGETSRRVKDPEGRSLSTTEHYESLTKCGAGFGPAFRTIQEIRAGEGWARTRVRIGDGEIGSASDYLAHPALLDGCLQTVIPALPRRQREVLYVPFGFSDLALFGEVGIEVSACATIREGSTIDSVLADVEIWRGEGLAARISGLRMNRL
ncbi:MAG: type I polyketide synthase, partial [Acidobacteriaceae bacterium]